MTEPFIKAVRLDRDRIDNPEAFPFSLPCVRNLDRLELDPQITFFVGENGSGKSTLIEAIAMRAGFNPEGGTKNFISRHRPSESSLYRFVRLARGMRFGTRKNPGRCERTALRRTRQDIRPAAGANLLDRREANGKSFSGRQLQES